MTYIIHTTNGSELYHHGILGQKWGVRRYQNADGTLTEAGKAHYALDNAKETIIDAQTNIANGLEDGIKKSAASQAAQTIVSDTVNNKKTDYAKLAKKITKGAAITASTTILSREFVLLYDNVLAPAVKLGAMATADALTEYGGLILVTLLQNT